MAQNLTKTLENTVCIAPNTDAKEVARILNSLSEPVAPEDVAESCERIIREMAPYLDKLYQWQRESSASNIIFDAYC